MLKSVESANLIEVMKELEAFVEGLFLLLKKKQFLVLQFY